MFTFTIDPRNGADINACNTCCCEEASGKPGETNPWKINYAAWSVPIGGLGLLIGTKFAFEKTVEIDNTDFTNTHYASGAVTAAAIVGDVSANIAPVGTYVYSLVPFTSPEHAAEFTFNSDGSWTYTSDQNWTGTDFFWFEVKDQNGIAERFKVEITVSAGGVAGSIPDPEDLTIDRSQVNVNSQQHWIDFPLETSHGAKEGEVHRLTIKQTAVDCDNRKFHHISCYDIAIGKCR